MKTKYYYEKNMSADEISITEATVESTKNFNAAQKFFSEKHALWDHFQFNKEAILEKCKINPETVDDKRIENILACEAIKIAISNSEKVDDYSFLKEKGIIDIDFDRGFAAISVTHPHLENFKHAFTIQPQYKNGLLSEGCRLLARHEWYYKHQYNTKHSYGIEGDLDHGVDSALEKFDYLSRNIADERVFQGKPGIRGKDNYKFHYDMCDHSRRTIAIEKIEFSQAKSGKKNPCHILGSAKFEVNGNLFTTAWKYVAQGGKFANPKENQIVIGLTKTKSITLMDYRTGEPHDDQTLHLSDEAKARISAIIIEKLSNNAEMIQNLTSTLSNAIPSSKDETGEKFKLNEEAISRLNKVAEAPKEQSKNRLKNKV